ncbi:dimethyladenosine transferase, putative [Perkinsus marinus ATCC 50983]|uniref:DNA polymerase II subunit 2 n=1 Tax=Perkinsus marinus (strain ATCC 50983 / TXsc) TaxID=423536 RepID=C5KPS9_PERM5|nr:dimethyladenosine transferase, putative [Perkinsus marinus ATCC 50983]EER13476.1 dimethyladenosine transferase, putative [Perkinsus marinus ATCC 50983]|eukprot:XP_002781681.1 dimethyladenosine transferase, putative [Perkinsus marinus ATCC 50983]
MSVNKGARVMPLDGVSSSSRPACIRLIDAYGSLGGPVRAGLRYTNAQDAQQFVPARKLPSVMGGAPEHSAMYRERFLALRKALWQSSGNPTYVDLAMEKIASEGSKMPKIRVKGLGDVFQASTGGMMERISINPDVEDICIEEPPKPEEQSLLNPGTSERIVITAVENLPGNAGVKFVFGLLSRASEGSLQIEDIHQNVKLDFSQCVPSSELIVVDASFVLLKGEMSDLGDGIFHVLEMKMPPKISRKFCDPTIDIFGATARDNQLGNHTGLLEISEIGQPGLESAEDLMVVVMGEVHLDDDDTLEKLADILFGFERMDQPPPAVYVFMGNFTKKPVNMKSAKSVRDYRACWARLSEELEQYPKTMANSQLVFVPGPDDPAGIGGLLPIPALGDYLTERIAKKFKGVHMCSNPVRIRMDLGGQVVEEHGSDLSNKADFIAFRSPDVCRKLYSNCIVRQLESTRAGTKEERQMITNREFFRAIAQQAHLCPVSQEVQPVIWGLDHMLQLHAPPNAVFICDQYVTSCEELVEDELVFCSTGEFKRSFTDTVLEMGPGTGNMSVKLSELANRVVAMEVNEGLAKEVERRAEMKGASNMEVVTGDFKRLALPRFDVVIANLPYHLATGFLLKLMGHPFRTGIIMLQHEFGKKLLADPGEKIYSRLSLNMRMFFKAERICKVPGRAFFPQPQTTSVIIRLTPRVPAPKVDFAEWDAMIRIAFFRKNQDVFKMFKRLTVLNMLEHNYKMWCSINRIVTASVPQQRNLFRQLCHSSGAATSGEFHIDSMTQNKTTASWRKWSDQIYQTMLATVKLTMMKMNTMMMRGCHADRFCMIITSSCQLHGNRQEIGSRSLVMKNVDHMMFPPKHDHANECTKELRTMGIHLNLPAKSWLNTVMNDILIHVEDNIIRNPKFGSNTT